MPNRLLKTPRRQNTTSVDEDPYARLCELFAARRATVGVFGLGPVGLQLARAAAARGGLRVIGIDSDETRIKSLQAGKSYFNDLPSEVIAHIVKDGLFIPTSDSARVQEADVVLVCVQTPLNAYREPDLSCVENATRAIARHARAGQLIILESTTYPGTTRDVLGPLFSERGFTLGEDIFLAFSPERHDPGNTDYGTESIPKVVGAEGSKALDLACRFYKLFVNSVAPVSSSDTAEAVKLTENIFRAVNISLINELKILYAAMGIDIWEVIEAAKTKPFGYMPFYPGPGIGGHCIPIDPFYLSWKARKYGLVARFVELAGDVNLAMPHYIVTRLAEALDERWSRGVKGTHILVMGVAFKKNVNDYRESPATQIMSILGKRGATVSYYDPLIEEIPSPGGCGPATRIHSIDWMPKSLSKYDAALIVTDHDDVDYKALVENARLVVDTRNACGRCGVTSPKIVKA
jgi:UDP-N-acetyl-D-glucosamine dehydrogenase